MNLKTLRNSAWIAVVGLAAAYGGYWYSQHRGSAAVSAADAQPAPDFSMVDLNGKTHQLGDHRGKLLLINFWASWCAPCLEEMPYLVEAQNTYGAQGLQILGPAMDELDPVKKIISDLGINYPVFQDYTQVDTTLKALGNTQGALPYSVLISRDGKVLETLLGGLTREQVQALLEKYIKA